MAPRANRAKEIDKAYAEMFVRPSDRKSLPTGAMPATTAQIRQSRFERNGAYQTVLDALRLIQGAMGTIRESMHDIDLRLKKFESKAPARK